MRIATYNVNGIRSRLGNLLAWLAREQPNVACLQELKAPDEGFPIEAIRAAGYGAIWQGQKSWNGVAILARGADPVESRRGLPGDRSDTQSRYLEAAVVVYLRSALGMGPSGGAPAHDPSAAGSARRLAQTPAPPCHGHRCSTVAPPH